MSMCWRAAEFARMPAAVADTCVGRRSVVVTFERACHLCYKRIGGSAFVAYPDGALAHYSCYKRNSNGASSASQGAPVFDISG